MGTRLWQLVCLAAALIAGGLSNQAAAADQQDTRMTHEGDEQTLVIAYHAQPANRAALQRELAASGAQQFAKWKNKGLVKDYRLLLNRYVDTDNPDALAVLTFATPADEQRWRRSERTTASGLSAKALALVSEIHTSAVETIRTGRSTPETRNSVFVAIPYRVLVSGSEYRKYADGYVIPQFEGWMQEGVLSHYSIYSSKYPAGRPWNAMVILEYKDDASLARREAVVASVRAKLKDNPEWKAISDSKKNVRDEQQLVIADAVASSREN